jgi:hypothetical protein
MRCENSYYSPDQIAQTARDRKCPIRASAARSFLRASAFLAVRSGSFRFRGRLGLTAALAERDGVWVLAHRTNSRIRHRLHSHTGLPRLVLHRRRAILFRDVLARLDRRPTREELCEAFMTIYKTAYVAGFHVAKLNGSLEDAELRGAA